MAANNKYGHWQGPYLHPSLGGPVLIQRTLSKNGYGYEYDTVIV